MKIPALTAAALVAIALSASPTDGLPARQPWKDVEARLMALEEAQTALTEENASLKH